MVSVRRCRILLLVISGLIPSLASLRSQPLLNAVQLGVTLQFRTLTFDTCVNVVVPNSVVVWAAGY